MLIYWFWKVFCCCLEPHKDRNARSILYIFSKYEPGRHIILLKAHIHTQSDRHTQTELWESCCVFIAWTSVSMDSCIPFSLLHTSFHRCYRRIPYNTQTSPSVYSVTLYLTLCGNELICCTETEISSFDFLFVCLFFVLFFAQFFCTVPHGVERNTCTQPDFTTCTISKCHAVCSPNENVFTSDH